MNEWFIEYVVLAVYLIGVTVIGTLAAKKVKSASTFFMGERKFGAWMMTFFTFGTGTSTDQAVGSVAKTYAVGASGIWYQWLWLFSTPFYWLLAPFFRRMRAVTTGDYLAIRYGASVAVLFSLVGILLSSVQMATVLKASSAIIESVTLGNISGDVAIIGMTVMFVIYGVAGGLTAAVITDFVQGILTVVLSFLILPFALSAVGGLDQLRTTIADPSFFELVSNSPGAQELGVFYVIVISINALIGWVTAPYTMQMCGAGSTENVVRIGFVAGMFLKRGCTIAWVLTGLCGIGMYMNADPPMHQDAVWGAMANDLLPDIMPGLLGLFIASVLAAVMSSCDCFMVSAAALFTENLYRPYIKPNQPEKHYVLIGRIASLIVVVGGVAIALRLSGVIAGLELFWVVQAMMGIPIWFSFFWRRATAAAAWASTFAGFGAWFFTSTVNIGSWTLWDFNGRFIHLLPDFMSSGDTLSLPWQMIIYLTFAAIVMIVVSLFTKPQDKDKLDQVYETLRTPVQPGEPEVAPLTLPETTKPAPRNPLIDLPGFEIMKPARSTVIGFLVSCGIVVLLIAIFAWIIRAPVVG